MSLDGEGALIEGVTKNEQRKCTNYEKFSLNDGY